MSKKTGIIVAAVAVLLLVGIFFLPKTTGGSDQLDSFAQCLKAKGITFYGAWWCPHCKAEKDLFSNSVQYLPYVECATPDGNAQTQICIDKGIKEYPTWVFPDGSQLTGTIPLQQLSDKSGCALPAGVSPSTPMPLETTAPASSASSSASSASSAAAPITPAQ